MHHQHKLYWQGSPRQIRFDKEGMNEKIQLLDQPVFILQDHAGRIGVANEGSFSTNTKGVKLLAMINPLEAKDLGDPLFRETYGLRFNYKTGAMANGIASEDLVIAMAKYGFLGSFGAAGLVPKRVGQAIDTIKNAVSDNAYAVNLIHSPNEPALERGAVEQFISKGVTVVEASAFLGLTENIVYYRISGLEKIQEGINIRHKVIAKISRKEVAIQFMRPAPQKFINQLLEKGKITQQQADLARLVPMADDITVEADSGGHTDNRPLVTLLPSIIRLRDSIQKEFGYSQMIRIGAAGGISTPESALSAFMMGAAYIVTGSVNQACLEAGTSDHVRSLLATVSQTDVMMAPASDMFEMGVELQVLKKGTLFGPRAKKLYDLYSRYSSIETIPIDERIKLEKTVFRATFDEIWQHCIDFFTERDPIQIQRAQDNPKRKMALIFRWYLGLSSNWANSGNLDRRTDMQIWCGPAMGAFNDWVKGTELEEPSNRKAGVVAEKIMQGAALLYRYRAIENQGISITTLIDVDELVENI